LEDEWMGGWADNRYRLFRLGSSPAGALVVPRHAPANVSPAIDAAEPRTPRYGEEAAPF